MADTGPTSILRQILHYGIDDAFGDVLDTFLEKIPDQLAALRDAAEVEIFKAELPAVREYEDIFDHLTAYNASEQSLSRAAGKVFSLIGGLTSLGEKVLYAPFIQAAEIQQAKRYPLKVPDAGTYFRNLIQTVPTWDFTDREIDKTFRWHGYGPWYDKVFEAASRRRLSPTDYFHAHRRGLFDPEYDWHKRLAMAGLFEDDAGLLEKLLETLPDAGSILEALRRGEIDPDQAKDRLHRIGYSDEAADLAVDLAWGVLARADLDRLRWAGQIGEQEYLDGLVRSGIGEDAAKRIVEWPYQPTPLSLLQRSVWWDKLTADEAAERAEWTGLNPDDAQRFADTLREPLDLGSALELLRRGEITSSGFTATAAKHGLDSSDAGLMERLRWHMPGVGDLIHMAVREAFTPEIVEKFHLDAEIPSEYLERAEKVGLKEEWAKFYWYAHWQLPSAGQGYEMMHRTKREAAPIPGLDRLDVPDKVDTWLSEEDMALLLRTLDISPRWRDGLMAISYHPMPRVDVRRAYEAGIVDAGYVYQTNRDLGYDDQTAKIMATWTHEEYTPRHLAMLRDQVLEALKRAAISEEEARRILAETCRFRDETVDFYIEATLYQRFLEKKDLSRTQVRDMLQEGLITEEEARERLHRLKYGIEEINHIMELWEIDSAYTQASSAARQKRPSLSDLQEFLRAGIIDRDTFYGEMHGIGYADRYIDWYYEKVTGRR